jgi:hypothetical protein
MREYRDCGKQFVEQRLVEEAQLKSNFTLDSYEWKPGPAARNFSVLGVRANGGPEGTFRIVNGNLEDRPLRTRLEDWIAIVLRGW